MSINWPAVVRALPDGRCRKRTVRAVLLDAQGQLVGIGVSGPAWNDTCRWQPGDGKDVSCEHAEWRAFASALGPYIGGTLYITREPCPDHCALLVAKRDLKVVLVGPPPVDELLEQVRADITDRTGDVVTADFFGDLIDKSTVSIHVSNRHCRE